MIREEEKEEEEKQEQKGEVKSVDVFLGGYESEEGEDRIRNNLEYELELFVTKLKGPQPDMKAVEKQIMLIQENSLLDREALLSYFVEGSGLEGDTAEEFEKKIMDLIANFKSVRISVKAEDFKTQTRQHIIEKIHKVLEEVVHTETEIIRWDSRWHVSKAMEYLIKVIKTNLNKIQPIHLKLQREAYELIVGLYVGGRHSISFTRNMLTRWTVIARRIMEFKRDMRISDRAKGLDGIFIYVLNDELMHKNPFKETENWGSDRVILTAIHIGVVNQLTILMKTKENKKASFFGPPVLFRNLDQFLERFILWADAGLIPQNIVDRFINEAMHYMTTPLNPHVDVMFLGQPDISKKGPVSTYGPIIQIDRRKIREAEEEAWRRFWLRAANFKLLMRRNLDAWPNKVFPDNTIQIMTAILAKPVNEWKKDRIKYLLYSLSMLGYLWIFLVKKNTIYRILPAVWTMAIDYYQRQGVHDGDYLEILIIFANFTRKLVDGFRRRKIRKMYEKSNRIKHSIHQPDKALSISLWREAKEMDRMSLVEWITADADQRKNTMLTEDVREAFLLRSSTLKSILTFRFVPILRTPVTLPSSPVTVPRTPTPPHLKKKQKFSEAELRVMLRSIALGQ